MTRTINSGQGRCTGTARLLMSPVQAVIELGASKDVLTKALIAAHHVNRQGSTDDFVAIALPMMRMGRNCMLPGHDVELIGSEKCLSDLLALDGIKSLVGRGMLKPLEIEEAFVDSGEVGAAYVRDRSCEKHTAGWLRRNKARAERRGKPWQNTSKEPKKNERSVLTLRVGGSVLHIRQVTAQMTNAPLMVSTFGFSSPIAGNLAVLPVLPDEVRDAYNAA